LFQLTKNWLILLWILQLKFDIYCRAFWAHTQYCSHKFIGPTPNHRFSRRLFTFLAYRLVFILLKRKHLPKISPIPPLAISNFQLSGESEYDALNFLERIKNDTRQWSRVRTIFIHTKRALVLPLALASSKF
jgi:hypothetical protein